MTDRMEARVRARLQTLRDGDLLRTLSSPRGIDLSSNDYLGLAGHPLLKQRMIEAVQDWGCGSTGSRLLRGHRDAFERVEQRFASFKGAERSLYFSSGYLANLAVLTALPEAGDVILSDERNHASLIDGIKLSRATCKVFPHNDASTLARLLREPRSAGAQVFLVTESLFSMDGDVPPLADYAELCSSAGACMVVDEAHAVGIYGARGSGLLEQLNVSDGTLLSVNAAGKTLGVSGAFVAGPAWVIEYLVQRARPFIFSTAPPPAVAAALDASLTIVASEPERRARLRDLAALMRARLPEAGVHVPGGFSQIIPVVIGENDRALAVASFLQSRGFDVRAIRPPSVAPGTARLRLSVNVSLSEDVIDRFAGSLAEAVRTFISWPVVSS
jgi:8-amino-7-oxononanoate synthase